MIARTRPTTATIGPMIAQRVTPLITLPPRTSSPCSVQTMPVRTRRTPITRKTHFIPVFTHAGPIRFYVEGHYFASTSKATTSVLRRRPLLRVYVEGHYFAGK